MMAIPDDYSNRAGNSPLNSHTLKGTTAAILVGDDFHVHEVFYIYLRLKEAGIAVYFVGHDADVVYHDYNGEPLRSDLSVRDAVNREFDCVYCPGGFAPMKMRANAEMLKFAKVHFESGRLFAAICHAGSFLVAMDVLKGRKATTYQTLKDDFINAGADYIDDAPVVDGNLITARSPDDLPVFGEVIVRHLLGAGKGARDEAAFPLLGKSVGLIIEQRYSTLQVWFIIYRLKAAGADVHVITPQRGTEYFSRSSKVSIKSDLSVEEASSYGLDALVIPGDWAADKMRIDLPLLKFVRNQYEGKKLLISIAEGHSVLISAKILNGVTVASPPEMKRDIENCNAQVVDMPICTFENIITCRNTEDLPGLAWHVVQYLRGRDPD